jgi:hypothetical protein
MQPSNANEQNFDPAERAREKQASRDADWAALERGEISREELSRRNGILDISFAKPCWDLAPKSM